MTEEKQDKLFKDLKVGSLEEVFLLIGSLRYTPLYIVELLYEDKRNVQDLLLDKVMNNNVQTKENYKNDIIVSGCDDILVNLASCCKPVYGDDIIGYITKGQGITVHKKDCINVKDMTTRLIDVEWNEHKDDDVKQYASKITILTNGINNSLVDIVAKATVRNINVTNMSEIKRNGNIMYDLLLKVKNKDDLEQFINDLEALSFIEEVKRY